MNFAQASNCLTIHAPGQAVHTRLLPNLSVSRLAQNFALSIDLAHQCRRRGEQTRRLQPRYIRTQPPQSALSADLMLVTTLPSAMPGAFMLPTSATLPSAENLVFEGSNAPREHLDELPGRDNLGAQADCAGRWAWGLYGGLKPPGRKPPTNEPGGRRIWPSAQAPRARPAVDILRCGNCSPSHNGADKRFGTLQVCWHGDRNKPQPKLG